MTVMSTVARKPRKAGAEKRRVEDRGGERKVGGGRLVNSSRSRERREVGAEWGHLGIIKAGESAVGVLSHQIYIFRSRIGCA